MSKQAIQSLPTTDLRAIVNSTNPVGNYAAQFAWAKDELLRRTEPSR